MPQSSSLGEKSKRGLRSARKTLVEKSTQNEQQKQAQLNNKQTASRQHFDHHASYR